MSHRSQHKCNNKQQQNLQFIIFIRFFFWKKLFAIAIPFLSFRRKISYFFVFIQFIYFDHNMICYFFHIVNKILLLIIKSKRKNRSSYCIHLVWFASFDQFQQFQKGHHDFNGTKSTVWSICFCFFYIAIIVNQSTRSSKFR